MEKLEQLSERERELLGLFAEGHINKTAAYELKLSPRTVEAHRANILKKLDCNFARALQIAFAAGMGKPLS